MEKPTEFFEHFEFDEETCMDDFEDFVEIQGLLESMNDVISQVNLLQDLCVLGRHDGLFYMCDDIIRLVSNRIDDYTSYQDNIVKRINEK